MFQTPRNRVHPTLFSSFSSSLLRSPYSATLAALAVIGVGISGAHFSAANNWLVLPAAAKSLERSLDFADIVDRVKPAVVGVRAQVEEGRPVAPGRQRKQVQQSHGAVTLGSGFLVSADGCVVTANHVIDRAKAIQIVTEENQSYSATVIGTDPVSDIALLKIDSDDNFQFVRLSDRQPRVGEWVLAIGNPFGLGGSVTAGIVSARARDINNGTSNEFIQIDASVNKGSSGGPTFDLDGNVIGVNSVIYSPSGGSIGIGFAIPAGTVKSALTQLKSTGVVAHGWIGVRIQAVNVKIAHDKSPSQQLQGALVVEAQANMPAAKAGLGPGDIITSLDGAPIKDDRELTKKISDMAPGTQVNLGVVRNGNAISVTVTLGQLPSARSEIARELRGARAQSCN